jgi:hypothetical protein
MTDQDIKDWIMALPTVRLWEVRYSNGECFEFGSYASAVRAQLGDAAHGPADICPVNRIAKSFPLARKHFQSVGDTA